MRSFTLILLLLSTSLWAQSGPTTEDQKTLKEMEQQINPLKEQVFETKARLRDLKAAVLEGKITGSKALVTFDNQAEGFFALTSAEFYLDDQLVKRVVVTDKSKTIGSLEVFDGDLPAGQHTLKAKVNYQGSDKSIYSAFSYFKDYKFQVDSNENFDVEYGKTSVVKLIALDKGYFKSNVRERLYMDVKILRDWGTQETTP